MIGGLEAFSTGWWLALAAVAATFASVSWLLARRFAVVADLWASFRALLVPLLGIALVASFSGSRGQTVLVFLLLAALLSILFSLDRGAWQAVVAALRPRGVRLLAGLLVLDTIFVWFIAPSRELVHPFEVASEALVWAGFLLWGAVLLLRVGVFSRSRLRIALSLVLLAGYARYFIWLFVADESTVAGPEHALWAAAVVGALVLVTAREDRDRTELRPIGARARAARSLGLSAALLSALAFMAAGLTGSQAEPPVERVDLRFDEIAVEDSPALKRPRLPEVIADNDRLKREFAPILLMSEGQRWEPVGVAQYLRQTDLYRRQDQPGRPGVEPVKSAPLTLSALEVSCARSDRNCFVLTSGCSLERSDSSPCERATDLPQGQHTRGTAYVRIARKRREPAAFPRWGPYRDKLTVLVQYWLFYPYDDWRTRTLFGEIRQGHEADWESVTIGFSPNRPLFVAYSAHCGGTWTPWEHARVAGRRSRRFHTIVGVAEGSQANYRDPEENIAPNWARCAGLRSDTVSAASLGYRIRDRTGVHTAIELKHLHEVTAKHPVMAFPGRWGLLGDADFYTAFDRPWPLEREPTGPRSPPLQDAWSDAVFTIFCDPAKRWRRADRKDRRRYCPSATSRESALRP